MAIVKRANCEFTVADHQVEEYLSKGYSLLGEGGKVIRENVPQTVKECMTKLEAANNTIKTQSETIEKLKEENAALKAQMESKSEKDAKGK